MADNKIQNSIDAVRKGLKEILTDMEVIDKKIIATAANAQKIGSGFKANTPDGLTQILKQQNDLLSKMNGLLDTQNNNTKKLNASRRTLKQLSGEEVVNQRKLAKNADLQAKSISNVVGAYDRLVAKYQIAKNRLNDLNAAQKKNTVEIQKATREFRKYQNKLNEVNRATSNFSKNSLGGMVRGFRNLTGAFGLVGGATLFAEMTRNIFNLVKEIEKLNYSLGLITESQGEFAQVQQFLIDISERYGLSLIDVTERYTKFLAASKQSGLALQDTEQIFESVSKASAVLGLRTDELTGVYLALEQMLSKGKVTTEELRRQLGERLPGAFGIMAEALGVSVSQLDEMLKKGEILSAEALPKFAKQLEKSYGIEAVNTVDTLTAAQNRLSTAWTNFVSGVESGEGTISRVFKGILGVAEQMVNALAKLTQGDTSFFNEERVRIAKQEMEDMEAVAKQLGQTIEDVARRNFFDYTKSVEEARETVNSLKERNKELSDEMANMKNAEVFSSKQYREYSQNNELLEKASQALAIREGRLDAVNQVLRKNTEETIINNDQESKKLEALRGSIAWLEQYIKKLEEEQSKLGTTTEQYRVYTQMIQNANEELIKLRATLDNLGVDTTDIKVNFDFKELQKQLKEGFGFEDDSLFKDMVKNTKNVMDEFSENWENTMDSAEAYAELKLNTVKEIFGGVFDTFSEAFDFDFSSTDFIFESLLDKENELFSTDNIDEWANFSKEAIGSVLDASLQRYQIELQEAQRARDLIVNNELATEKEKRIAREKFEEEERRIKTKQAKEERRNTLIKIATDTAAGIVSALAQIPKFDFGISATAFSAFIAASGAAQAALVASQPLPKFAEGTKSPLADDTLAWVGDGGRREAVTKNGKLLDITPDRPTLAMLPKGAEVQKDASEWINNAIYRMNMSANGELLNSFDADYLLHDELKKMRSANDRTWQEVKKLAKRPIFVKNTVKVIQEDSYKI